MALSLISSQFAIISKPIPIGPDSIATILPMFVSNNPLINSHVFIANSFTVSQFLYNKTPIAMSAAIPRIINPIGFAFKNNKAVLNALTTIITPLTIAISLAIISNTGPIAATNKINLTILPCVSGDNSLNLAKTFLIISANSRNLGMTVSVINGIKSSVKIGKNSFIIP